MGGKKRKSTGGPVKKESKYKIPRRFDCPVCDAKASIAVKVFTHEGHKEALIKCRNCGLGAQDGRRPMLWLEKAVDAFFAFREELMEKDRAYLEQQGLIIGDIAGGASAPSSSSNAGPGPAAAGATVVRDLAELDKRTAMRAAHSGAAAFMAVGSSSRARGADNDADTVFDTAAEYVEPRLEVHRDEDEYGDMFS